MAFFSLQAFSICALSKARFKQIDHAQAAAMHFVLVGGTDAAAGGADLLPPRGALPGQLDHAMVGQDDLGAVGDEKLLIDVDPEIAKLADFFQKGHRVEHHSVTDDGAAVGPEHSARDQLKNELLPPDDDRMSRIVPSGVAGHDIKSSGEDVNDLPFAFIAPLGAEYYSSFGSHTEFR